MTQTINWQPENDLNEEIIKLAKTLNRSPSAVIESAIREYLEKNQKRTNIKHDPLIGLFASKPDLSTESEDILTQEINPSSGWTWKE